MLSDYIHTKFDSDIVKGQNKPKKTKLKNEPKSELIKRSTEEELKVFKKDPLVSPTICCSEDHQAKHEWHLKDQIREKFHEFIGHLDHVPAFLKDNEFIHTGYRINFSTPKKVLKSLFMIHNESVNIWSHLAGAIMLIILCVFLCFSVSSLDTQNIKEFVQLEVRQIFEPVYNNLPNFTQLEQDISEKITQTKDGITKFGEDTVHDLGAKLESISVEIENFKKNNINPEAIGEFLNKLKDELKAFSDTVKDLRTSVSAKLEKEKLEGFSKDLKKKLHELQDELIVKIDSSDLDWIDIYKYIDPNYSKYLTTKDGQFVMPLSRWPIIVFLLSAVFCLMCSAIFHLFYCLSQRANQIFMRLDYAGISILITGSCFPPFVYGFYCQPVYSKLYLSLIGVTSVIVFFVSLSDRIHTQAYIKVKAMMYGGLGVFAGLPMIHLTYLTITMSELNDNLDFSSSLPYYLSMGFAYLGGLTIYSHKCPERYNPGKYDICGHSHQIWHVCVLLGVILTYFGSFDNYYTRMQMPCMA